MSRKPDRAKVIAREHAKRAPGAERRAVLAELRSLVHEAYSTTLSDDELLKLEPRIRSGDELLKTDPSEWAERRKARDKAARGSRRQVSQAQRSKRGRGEWDRHVVTVELERLVSERSSVEADIDKAVARLRECGASWAEVGAATGLSRDGAVSRWGRRRP